MIGAYNAKSGQYEYADSELVSRVMWHPNYTEISNKVNTRITPHHMAGRNLTPESIYNVMTNRSGSANYCIFNDGKIVQYVKESRRAWTTSTGVGNDNFAVTIEVENSTGDPTWEISATAMNALVNLMADIAKRNNIVPLRYTGDTSGNVTLHKWFAATACPGPYMTAKMPEIVNRVNALIGGHMELGIGLNEITFNGIRYEVVKGYGDYKQGYVLSAPGTPETTALQSITKFDSSKMLILSIVNLNYFEMSRQDIYGTHYGVEYSVGDGIYSQGLALPAYNPELLAFYQRKDGRCGWCRATSFNLKRDDVIFAFSPYSIRFHEGREINEISTCFSNKELTSTKQTALCMLQDGTWIQIVSVDNTIPAEVANLMKAIGAYEGVIMDGGGSSQLVYIGQPIINTRRQLPNVFVLACFKPSEGGSDKDDESPTDELKQAQAKCEELLKANESLKKNVASLEEKIKKARAMLE